MNGVRAALIIFNTAVKKILIKCTDLLSVYH